MGKENEGEEGGEKAMKERSEGDEDGEEKGRLREVRKREGGDGQN